MQPLTYLVRPTHEPARAAFPVIDAHNHLWGDWNVQAVVQTMDACGVACYCDLTANAHIRWAEGGYVLESGRFEEFVEHAASRHPGRFHGFTMSSFARPADKPLFTDAPAFVAEAVEMLRRHVALGARGLKLTKELGLHFRDGQGRLINVDDERLAPIFAEAAVLSVPVLIHQSDPIGYFEPVTPANEHYDTMRKYPSWSFADAARFPRKTELIRRRDALLRAHPHTNFILPHVANYPEDLDYVGRLLDENPNVCIDFSARMDELGRQPYSAREFFIRYQDRIVFGTDMPAGVPTSQAMYRCYFRFLETFDEYFFPPDYDATFERRRWPICGLGLPRDVLAKVYYRNALRLIPGLEADYRRARHQSGQVAGGRARRAT